METVGLLGDVSREQAMASLLSAPLLEDLAEWSQWELVFQPNHGPLKHFIDKYCGMSPQLHERETDNLEEYSSLHDSGHLSHVVVSWTFAAKEYNVWLSLET